MKEVGLAPLEWFGAIFFPSKFQLSGIKLGNSHRSCLSISFEVPVRGKKTCIFLQHQTGKTGQSKLAFCLVSLQGCK